MTKSLIHNNNQTINKHVSFRVTKFLRKFVLIFPVFPPYFFPPFFATLIRSFGKWVVPFLLKIDNTNENCLSCKPNALSKPRTIERDGNVLGLKLGARRKLPKGSNVDCCRSNSERSIPSRYLESCLRERIKKLVVNLKER